MTELISGPMWVNYSPDRISVLEEAECPMTDDDLIDELHRVSLILDSVWRSLDNIRIAIDGGNEVAALLQRDSASEKVSRVLTAVSGIRSRVHARMESDD